jgi:catechol 2,3-dioxygenase-like lactoylglutathione lyase family enzyme
MTEVLAELAPHFFQVAYVVPEIASAERFFERTLGVRGFTRLADVHLAEGCEHRGRPADCVVHLSLGWLGDTQVELIESVRGESIYAEHLDQKGPGLHHVAFLVPDFDAVTEAFGRGALTLASRGALGAGMRFAYYDCQGPGFSLIEILDFDQPTRDFMDGLRRAAR